MEHELDVISGKIVSGHVHLFIGCRPTQNINKIMQWLKAINSRILLSEFTHLCKEYWDHHLRARGYLAVSPGNIADEMIQKPIEDQGGKPTDEGSRFQFDSP